MSLNYDFGGIDKSVRLTVAPNDGMGYKVGEAFMNPVAKSLIFVTMALGMGEITEANYKDFYKRLRFFEALHGPLLQYEGVEGAESLANKRFTIHDIKAHIGLRTNVSFETESKWRKRTIDNFDSDTMQSIRNQEDRPDDNEPFYVAVDRVFRTLADKEVK